MKSFSSLFIATALLVGIPGAHTSAWEKVPIKVLVCDTNSCTEITKGNIVPLSTWAKICSMKDKGYVFVCNVSDSSNVSEMYSNIIRMQELNTVITELEKKFDKDGKLSPVDQDNLDDAWEEWMDRANQEFPKTQNFKPDDRFASRKLLGRTSVLPMHHYNTSRIVVFSFT